MKQKKFHEVLTQLSENPHGVKKAMLDQRPTYAEKKIFAGYGLLRENKHHEILDLLQRMGEGLEPYVKAHAHLLKGHALNYLQEYMLSMHEFKQAFECFESLQVEHFSYVCLYNLFLVHMNLKEYATAKKYLHDFQIRFKSIKAYQKRILHASFTYEAICGRKAKGLELLSAIREIFPELDESEASIQLVVEFMFYVKHDMFDQCYEVLEQLKVYRVYRMSGNFEYMKLMLNNYVKDKTLYFSDSSFQDSPPLLNELKIIQKLEEGSLEEAAKFWDLNAKKFPGVYGKDFDFKGEKCIFSLCLKKHLSKLKASTPIQVQTRVGSTPLARLYEISKSIKGPIPKEQLFFLVFERQAESKEDFAKIFRLVYKLNAKYGVEFKTKKGTYVPVMKEKRKVS